MLNQLSEIIQKVPDEINNQTTNYNSAIEQTINYLKSDVAFNSLQKDPYWPKWNSPWWHMQVLHEMGLAKLIPDITLTWVTEALTRQYISVFLPEEIPTNRNPATDTYCHCALGNMYQILSAAGVNIDVLMPWAKTWFVKYQMFDGGLNCDENAYTAKPPASSMVGTIAGLEALLLYSKTPLNEQEENFLNKGAEFLIGRQLMKGCTSEYNKVEQLDEIEWLQPCFPRFYLYDVLRGLRFILMYADLKNKTLPASAIYNVVKNIQSMFPDGNIKNKRQSFEGVGTRILNSNGQWERNPKASFFPLLEVVSKIDEVSPFLTKHWLESATILKKLIKNKQIS